MKRICTLLFIFCSSLSLFAQKADLPAPGTKAYDAMKKDGKLQGLNAAKPDNKTLFAPVISNGKIEHPPITQSSACQCMIPLDGTFSVVPMSGGSPPDYRNDDGSSSAIPIPFSFCFYGTNYNSIYINNNGNISFGSAYSTFTASGFPSSQFSMIAPFWGDVDTWGPASGLVYYKITPTAVIVKWDAVGYYSSHTDKLNTFQLVITNGSDPLVQGGNVSFCYGDMQWTTGDASSGTNGFGGFPSTVGANEGNGIDYIQLGQFDSPGQSYSGPFPVGPPYEGIDWLDYKSFVFNTCNSSNIAPIPSGIQSCDTIQVCEGDTLDFNISFLSPEQSQNTTATVSAPGVNGFTVISNTPGNNAIINAQFIASISNFGYNTITFSATDNGTPAQTTIITLVLHVDSFAAPLPVITGNNQYCQGGSVSLSVGPGPYDSYSWNTGATSQVLNSATQGTYTASVTYNGCTKTATFTVTELPTPVPVLSGQLATCGSDSAQLMVDTTLYSSYTWSTGATTSSITVGSGTYSVAVTDTNGCTGSSAPLTISQSPKPTAGLAVLPSPAGFIGDSIHFSDLSTVASGNVTSWFWSFGDGATSTQQDPVHAYVEPGTYNVCLIAFTPPGCSDTTCITYEVQPYTVEAPNVFTPNGDGKNEFFAIKNLEFYPDNHVIVFNRWGKKMFEKEGYQNDWNGEAASDGVYYYILEVPVLQQTFKGFVQILR
jgi:gliding motility-associated-like protein